MRVVWQSRQLICNFTSLWQNVFESFLVTMMISATEGLIMFFCSTCWMSSVFFCCLSTCGKSHAASVWIYWIICYSNRCWQHELHEMKRGENPFPSLTLFLSTKTITSLPEGENIDDTNFLFKDLCIRHKVVGKENFPCLLRNNKGKFSEVLSRCTFHLAHDMVREKSPISFIIWPQISVISEIKQVRGFKDMWHVVRELMVSAGLSISYIDSLACFIICLSSRCPLTLRNDRIHNNVKKEDANLLATHNQHIG